MKQKLFLLIIFFYLPDNLLNLLATNKNRINRIFINMQDKAIAAIGALQLEKDKGLETVDFIQQQKIKLI